MSDWAGDLDRALTAGDPEFMKAMLARVPPEVLQRAVPYLEQMARQSVEQARLEEALTYYGQLIAVAGDVAHWHAERARVYLRLDQLPEALQDASRVVELEPGAALGYRLKAEAHEGMRERAQALAAYRQILQLQPDDAKSRERIAFLEAELHKEALLKRTLDPAAAAQELQIELPPRPQINFDPQLLAAPAIPQSVSKPMLEGLRQHLWRYSGQQSVKNVLARLDDEQWRTAWEAALRLTAGACVLFQGSELGILALRAKTHGARRVIDVEPHPQDGRIAGGMVQKHYLAAWHRLHGAAIASWSEEERGASFEAFAAGIDVVAPSSDELGQAQCDYFIFPNIDHTLLGTGIIKAIRQWRGHGALGAQARILPARARLFAMAVQWTYPASEFQLEPLNALRWSLYPQPLDIPATGWVALSEPTPLGAIDFAEFSDSHWELALPIIARGSVDAIIYWFELELGEARITNAPGSGLQCIKPAVQYCDPIPVEPGGLLPLQIQALETRLRVEPRPAPARHRAHLLPSWYVPMLLDQKRNEAYGKALRSALGAQPAQLVLDIGAGCGLLSMLAAQAGAPRVVGCEMSQAIAQTGSEILQLNGFDERIVLINKDCRKMTVPQDLPAPADLAVFELFDCSLIGEGVLHFLAHAREHLLAPNARYLPRAGRICALIIEYRFERLLDIDATLLNPYRFSPSFVNVDAGRLSYRALTEPFEVFTFDFSSASPQPQEKTLAIAATSAGIAGAVLFWFDLQIDETNWLSNAPHTPEPLHWKQGLQLLPEVRIQPGAGLPLLAQHDGSGLRFKWQQDALREQDILALPRLDQRSWAQIKELEYQTQGLLQHCLQHPEEYRQVAELAQRLAVDPAAHDLDAQIASRFASAFFGS